MNSSAFTTVIMLSLMLNLFIFVANNELIGAGITYNAEEQPLSNYVDLTNPNSPTTGESVPTDINSDSGVVSSSLGIVDWLGKIWNFITGIFKFFFAVYLMMVDLGSPQSIAYLFGLPIALAQMVGVFSFIRGVNS